MKLVIGDPDNIGLEKLLRVLKFITQVSLDKDFVSDIYEIFYSEKPQLISPLNVPYQFMNRYVIEGYLILTLKWTRMITKGYRERSIITSAMLIDEILNWINPKIDEHKQIFQELIGKGGKEVNNDTIKRLVDDVVISLQKRMSNLDLLMYTVRALTEVDSLDPFSELLVIRFLNKIVDYPPILAEIIKLSKDEELRDRILERLEMDSINEKVPLDKVIDVLRNMKGE